MWPTCPLCYSAITGPPIVAATVDTLALHMRNLHGVTLGTDGTYKAVPGFGPAIELRAGQAATVAILLNGSTTTRVTWPTPMPSSTYRVSVALSPALLGAVKTPEITAQTAAHIDVKLTSSGLAVAASTLMAVAGAIVTPTT